jgi:5-methyltetrahydropteroyltriglutamate--homocysteine methyltransferase
MKRSENRILTTHVGSLIRPPALLAAIKSFREGSVDEAALDAVRRAAIREVVGQQIAVGLDIVNDGEFGKNNWANYILQRIEGFELRPDKLRPVEWLGSDGTRFAEYLAATFPQAARGFPTEACVGPIRYRSADVIERSVAELVEAVQGQSPTEVFMTAVAPASTAFDGIDEFYGNEHDYVFAIAEALRTEYLAIDAAGFLVQVDDAVLANMYDHLVRQSPARYREWAQLRVDALNHALRGIPEEHVRYHVCFGSWHLPHISDAPLEDIVDLILQVKAGAYSIEAANARHEHEWRVWESRKLPNDRILIPGVVTHHTVTVEHPRLVADRLVRFAKLLGRENVIAGTDCGFAQVENVQRVHPTIMWAKFEALVAGAALASRELWGR